MECWFKCRHCRKVLLYKDSSPDEHEKKCHKFPVPCLSQNVGCRKKVPRDELEAHIRTCPFHRIRDFLRMRQLQYEKVTLQMLTVQKSEVLIRKEHLEAIVKHQKLLGKYQYLFKEHVNLMEKMKKETTKERDYLLLMKRSRETEVKYIKLSEQFILLGERNKKLQWRILATDQQVRRDAISEALSKGETKEFDGLLQEFLKNAKVQYEIQHAELQSNYKSFLSIHEENIKKSFETMLNKSEKLFTGLYGDIYEKRLGTKDALKTLKENDLNFLEGYQKLMSNQLSSVSTLFSEFLDTHRGIQDRQLARLSNAFGMSEISLNKDEIPEHILESVDLSDVAPQILRSYNISKLERKIKLLEGLRDGVTPITEEVLRNAIEQEPGLAISTPTENLAIEEDEIKLPPEDEPATVYEVSPDLQLDISEFRVRHLPPAPDFEVDLNMLNVGMVPPEPFEDTKEELILSDEKEEADEKEPITLPLNFLDSLPESLRDNRGFPINSDVRVPLDPRNNFEHPYDRNGRLTPVDIGLGMRPLLLDPTALAEAVQEGSRRLLGIKSEEDVKSGEVD